MSNLKKLLFIFGFILFFTSCTEDESINDSCFTCETTQTEYCYTIGNSFYSTTGGNLYTETELNGASWSDTQTLLEAQCDGTTPTEDCYTCNSSNTEYCYTIGETFYTTTVNGSSEDTNLNGETWTDLRAGFVENCDDGNQTASIVGDWNLINYQMSSETTTTIDDVDVITYTESVGVTYNTINHFTEDPNQLTSTGTSILRMTFTDENGEETIIDDVELSAIDSTWELNGNVLTTTTTTDGVTETSEILELTDTTLKIKNISTREDTDLDDNPRSTTFNGLITYERL